MLLAIAKKLALFPCIILWCSTAVASSVHLRGSTTLLPIAQTIAESYMHEHPDVRIVIGAGSTERGYKAIVDGTADIAMASSVARDDIVSECALKNIKLNTTLLGYTTILTVVNPANPIKNLSLKQVKDIFTGRITNWRALGGVNAPINVYVGPPNGGINDTWKKLILGEDDTYTPKGIVKNNAERILLTAADANAITFLTLDDNNTTLKILTINNIAATSEAVVENRYPLRAPLMLVTANTPTTTASEFIHYFSAQLDQIHINNITPAKLSPMDSHHE
jgi:phosphate transport system substrate-binding protein